MWRGDGHGTASYALIDYVPTTQKRHFNAPRFFQITLLSMKRDVRPFLLNLVARRCLSRRGEYVRDEGSLRCATIEPDTTILLDYITNYPPTTTRRYFEAHWYFLRSTTIIMKLKLRWLRQKRFLVVIAAPWPILWRFERSARLVTIAPGSALKISVGKHQYVLWQLFVALSWRLDTIHKPVEWGWAWRRFLCFRHWQICTVDNDIARFVHWDETWFFTTSRQHSNAVPTHRDVVWDLDITKRSTFDTFFKNFVRWSLKGRKLYVRDWLIDTAYKDGKGFFCLDKGHRNLPRNQPDTPLWTSAMVRERYR